MNNPLKNLKTISLFLFLLLSFNAYSECTKGNCDNGKGEFTWLESDGTINFSCTYTGDWVNGKLHGKGTEICQARSLVDDDITYSKGESIRTYTGDWVNGKLHGKGTYIDLTGGTYTGDWVNGERNGKGISVGYQHEYTGDFVNQREHGKGTLTWDNGNKYEGDFVNGDFASKGTYTWADGSKYTGDFVGDGYIYSDTYTIIKHGKGTYTSAGGVKRTGYWSEDEYLGTVEKVYDDRYSVCLVDKGAGVDMSVQMMRDAIHSVCSSIAEKG
jgi:hypothetical protein